MDCLPTNDKTIGSLQTCPRFIYNAIICVTILSVLGL